MKNLERCSPTVIQSQSPSHSSQRNTFFLQKKIPECQNYQDLPNIDALAINTGNFLS